MYIGNLLADNWVKRTLQWTPLGARVAGYLRHDWTSKFHACTTYSHTDDRPNLTLNSAVWKGFEEDFASVFRRGCERPFLYTRM